MPATRTLGGALALAASVGLVLLGLRAAAGPVGTAGAATWIPPAYEFQTEGVEPGTPLQPEAALAPRLAGAGPLRPEAREPPRTAQAQPAMAAQPAGPRPAAGPDLLTIGRWAAAPAPPAAATHAPGIEPGRLAELQNLVTALYRALSEPRAADSHGPLLALSPVPVSPAAVTPPAVAVNTPVVPSSVQWAASGLAGPSGPDWVDPSAATIAAIERRLDQQIRLNKSAPEIAQTQFALAQVLWNSSDAAELQSRALSLARQSKAALDTVSVEDSSVVELRQAVNDWLIVREGPAGKPRGGGLTRGQLKRELLDPTL